jgi:hypothetical protein
VQITYKRQHYMKDKLIIAVVLLVAIVILANADWGNRTVVYDCSIAEISPDYPQAVKNECRRLRIEEFRERQVQDRRTISI